ncbi:MAG TPA: type II toxin-antitoxin system MqsA family antitoxin [Roseiflexaceae bacterium]|jgi:YgiT-type zinc finger domain-containing protein|nr:type II toxin-antitoxin system MqsA family antitoxin [Roseiflexaceae bacterium]
MSNKARPVDQLICAHCGKPGARIRHITRSYGKGETLLVIENVPTISCPSCGESYLTAQTLHEIERIKQQRKQLATTRPVAVAEFAQAA